MRCVLSACPQARVASDVAPTLLPQSPRFHRVDARISSGPLTGLTGFLASIVNGSKLPCSLACHPAVTVERAGCWMDELAVAHCGWVVAALVGCPAPNNAASSCESRIHSRCFGLPSLAGHNSTSAHPIHGDGGAARSWLICESYKLQAASCASFCYPFSLSPPRITCIYIL